MKTLRGEALHIFQYHFGHESVAWGGEAAAHTCNHPRAL